MEVGLRSKNSINQTPGGQVRCRMDIYRYTAPIGGDTNRHKDKEIKSSSWLLWPFLLIMTVKIVKQSD